MARVQNYRMSRYDFLASQPTGKSVITQKDRAAFISRLVKRYMKEEGTIGPKLPSTWQIDIGESKKLEVVAFTRSEARAKLKKELGVKRLPVGIKIEKVIYESNLC